MANTDSGLINGKLALHFCRFAIFPFLVRADGMATA